MSDDRDWLLLCECNSTAELHVLRATLQAHGVPCQLQGEHTHSVLGPIHGAISRPRVLVPRGAMELARELAEDIVGPFESSVAPQDDDDQGSPYRAEPKLDLPSEAADTTPPRKSFGILVLGLFLFVPPFLGVTHLYAGRRVRAGILALASVLLVISGSNPWLVLVWIADVIGGGLAIASYNREQQALTDARDELEPAEDGFDDDERPLEESPEDEPPPDEHPVWRLLRRLRTGSTDAA